MSNFITNSGDRSLKNRINTLISQSIELKFLVGFFYFSGMTELIDSLKANTDFTLKILVGLSIDSQSYGLVEYAGNPKKMRGEKIEDYHQSVISAINNDVFDNELFYEQASFVIDKIIEGRIILRKTASPNHAKLYLFRLSETQIVRTQLFITGSSNLSKAGLSDREEFNVELSDYGYIEAEKYFDDLWNTAYPITESDVDKQKLIHNIREKTLLKSIHPFDAYMFVVKTWLDSFYKQESGRNLGLFMERKGYKPFKYQIDAVTQALSIVKDNGGVILADVVGLGKSIIASLIARKLEKRGIIICPPGLIGDSSAGSGWNKYKEHFELYDWKVHSTGDLDGLLEYMENTGGFEVVIIDEAHRFRNSGTESYEKLKTICRGKEVILLTATPFNNTPADILSLLSLFIVPKKSNISLSDNLVDVFRFYNRLFGDLSYIRKHHDSADPAKAEEALRKYAAIFGDKIIIISKVMERSKLLSKQIREVLEPVTIRRNRLDLLNDPDYQDEINKLSQIDDPKEWYYCLSDEQSVFYDRVIQEYFTDNKDISERFRGPIYKPYKYESSEGGSGRTGKQDHFDRLSQDNIYDILRRQVVKRFESSFGAFRQSIVNLKESYEKIKLFIASSGGRYVLNRKLINSAELEDPDFIDLLLEQFSIENIDQDDKKSRIYDVNSFQFKDEFFADIESDLRLFERIIAEIDRLDLVNHDPKCDTLLSEVQEVISQAPKKGEPRAKVIIFSEYADTVKYLEPKLREVFAERLMVVMGNITERRLKEIHTNFDASMSKAKQVDDYEVLLTTDKLSEGFDLNRASMVINYDIPWNPVRVIQRFGRINRISKKVFDTLSIVNFFPTQQGADIVKSREIASQKMFMIHQTLGEDARIFDTDEEPTPAQLFTKIQRNPYEIDGESLYTKLKKQMRQWEEKYPERVKKLDDIPIRIKTAKPYDENSQLLFIKKGRLFCVSENHVDENEQLIPLPFEEAIKQIKCTPETEHLKLSPNFWETYKMLKTEAEKFSFKESSQSNSVKAHNLLSDLIEKNRPELTDWQDFLIMLREDINEYGTLPDYTLKRICDWENGGEYNYDEIKKEIETLSETLGNKYLKKVKESLKAYEQHVIVAIENRSSVDE